MNRPRSKFDTLLKSLGSPSFCVVYCMRIPIVDHLVDRGLAPQPKRVRFAVEVPLEIKAGQRSASVEIPCAITANHFSISFPQGIEYVYGDVHKETKTEGSESRPDPSIQVCLPDIADVDLKIPVSLGFSHNPASLMPWLSSWIAWASLAALFIWCTTLAGLTLVALFPASIAAFAAIFLAVQVRAYQRTRTAFSKYSTRQI